MKYVQYFETPVGWMGAAEEDSRLVEVFFGRRPLSPGEVSQRTDLLARTIAQLGEYFSGQRRQFDLPLGGQGSAFSQAVWQALLGIPYGQTRTYGQTRRTSGTSPGFPGRWPRLSPQSAGPRDPLPPGGGSRRIPDRLCRRNGRQSVPLGPGSAFVGAVKGFSGRRSAPWVRWSFVMRKGIWILFLF